MNVAAKRPITDPIDPGPVRRFALPDLHATASWLLDRLAVRYAHLRDVQIAGYLRGLIDSNEYLFIRTNHAVALMQRKQDMLSLIPHVNEVFVLCENPKNPAMVAEAGALYEDIKRWAEGMGARNVIVENFTDVSRETIKGVFGRVFLREVTVVLVGPDKRPGQ